MSEPKLSAPQADLLAALRAGVICHYMPYAGRFCPTAYYFRSDSMRHCTAQVKALLARGLAEKFDKERFGNHKIRAVATPPIKGAIEPTEGGVAP